MANASRVEQFEKSSRHELPSIQTEMNSAKSTEHQMVMAMTMEGKFRVKLAGVEQATAQVIPLKDYSWSMNQGTKLSRLEEPTAEHALQEIKDDHFSEADAEISEQIEQTHASADDVKMLAELFRDFGADDVFVYDGGIDMRKYGNRFDLSHFDLVFVIPETRKDELKKMLSAGVDDPDGLREQVRTIMPLFEFEIDNEQGLKVKMRIGDREQSLMFLCGEVWGSNREEQKQIVEREEVKSTRVESGIELSEVDSKIYDKITEICIAHKNDNEECKNEILKYLVEENKSRISTELKSVLEADEMFRDKIPTDLE